MFKKVQYFLVVLKQIVLGYRSQHISHCSIVSSMERVVNTPDSYIHKGYLQQQGTDTAALKHDLLQTAPWNKRDNPAMKMRGHQLKRTKFFALSTMIQTCFSSTATQGFSGLR